MSIRHIFLDMDGVLVDFVGAALQVHDQPEAIHSWPPGEWDIPTVLGISASQFWQKIDRGGHQFWADLLPYTWTSDLVDAIRQVAPFTILTSPSLHPQCPAGKVSWLYAHLGGSFRDFLIGHQKHLCANPGAVLIDDNDTNVRRFREHGGQAILFPQPWNSNHAIQDRLEYVVRELQNLAL